MEDQDPIDRMLEEIEASLSPAELASAEYFANLAFDERLQNLIEAEPSKTRIALSSQTRQFIESPFFPPTEYAPTGMGMEEFKSELLEPVYEYHLTGELNVDGTITSLDLTIRDADSKGATKIRKNPEQPDTFVIERTQLDIPGSWTLQDTRGLFHTLAKLLDEDVREVTKAMQSIERTFSGNPKEAHRAINKMYEQLVIQLWNEAGEQGTIWKKTRQLSLDTPLQDPPFDTQSLRLEYAELENPKDSLIQITFERSNVSEELDMEDVYSLRLVLNQQGDSSNRLAKHMIVSGTDAHRIRGFSFSHSHQGKTTLLDVTDPEVQEMFIDWFDQLVSG